MAVRLGCMRGRLEGGASRTGWSAADRRDRPVGTLVRGPCPTLLQRCAGLVWGRRASHTGRLPPPSAAKAVVIVESPTKATKIQRFLGEDYTVLASYGHVRDLPARNGSVDPDNDFALKWELTRNAGSRMADIEAALWSARHERSGGGGGATLVLATDPDREGEAISWHLAELLAARGVIGPSTRVSRIAFSEITKDAVLEAMAQPRELAVPLVHAYLARRALDYLVGFRLSPVLWRRLPGARSAGRVQSVALRLVAEREAEVDAFEPTEYWSIDVELRAHEGSPPVLATLTHVDGKKLPEMAIRSADDAAALAARVEASDFKVRDVSSKTVSRSPPPPFTTSTLQQDASRWLGFGATRTMVTAQRLYEGAGGGEGLITYMRTDGLQLAPSAVASIRSTVERTFGADYVPPSPRAYKSRAKNAQEAHEAVRPTRPGLSPGQLGGRVDADGARLYDLVWRRALACQMANAAVEQVGVNFESADASLRLRATGSAVRFPGFLKVYDFSSRFGSAESQQEDGGDGSGSASAAAAAEALAALQPAQAVQTLRVLPLQHTTRPPPRYSEASLIKALEELGIGRPSTYAAILSVLQARGYVLKEGRSLQCSPLGRVLSAFLVHYFSKYVDYGFTRDLEEQLDDVSGGQREWREVMSSFWGPFSTDVDGMAAISITDVFNVLDDVLGPHFFRAPLPKAGAAGGGAGADAAAVDPRECPGCSVGRLVLKPSRAGGFIGCSRFDSDGCKYARPLAVEQLVLDEQTGEMVRMASDGHTLGAHPDNGFPVVLKNGPFGQYVELVGSEELPEQQAQVSPAADADAQDGVDDGDEALLAGGAGVVDEAPKKKRGRKAKAKEPPKPKPKRAPLPKGMDGSSITLDQAVALLALPRMLGRHPDDGAPVIANTGRFGPYVAHGGVNSALGKKYDVHTATLEDALALLAAKTARMAARAARAAAGQLTAADRRAMAAAARAAGGRKGLGRAPAKPKAKPAAAAAAAPKRRGRLSKAAAAGAAEALGSDNDSVDGVQGGDAAASTSARNGRGRARKVAAADTADPSGSGSCDGSGDSAAEHAATKRRRRPRKFAAQDAADPIVGDVDDANNSMATAEGTAAPKRRGRPRKSATQDAARLIVNDVDDANNGIVAAEGEAATKRRGRPRKSAVPDAAASNGSNAGNGGLAVPNEAAKEQRGRSTTRPAAPATAR